MSNKQQIKDLIDLGQSLVDTNKRILQAIEAMERCDLNDDEDYADNERWLTELEYNKEQLIKEISHQTKMKTVATTTGLVKVRSLFQVGKFFFHHRIQAPARSEYVISHETSGKMVTSLFDYDEAVEFTTAIGKRFTAIVLTEDHIQELANFTHTYQGFLALSGRK